MFLDHKYMKKNILISGIILISALCLFLFLFYNQNKIVAQEEVKLCAPEIPIGEAMEESAVLLSGFISELQAANYQISKEIEAAEEMINLAEQYDIKKCQPVCIKVAYECGYWTTICPPKGKCTNVYVPKTCYRCEVNACSGQPCPNEQIRDEFNKIETRLSQIVGLSGRLKNMLNSKIDVVDKLAESRQEFDNCAFSPSDWLAAERGEKTPRYSLSCTMVLKENFPRKEEECKSLYNFFCCQ